MEENNDKELAYRVIRDKTPILDIYFDGSYKIRTDIPEEERSRGAKGFYTLLKYTPIEEFEFWQEEKESSPYPDERQYYPPSDEYIKAYRTLQMFNYTPDYMSERIRRETEVQVFGSAEVPWGTVAEGFYTGTISVYERRDGTVSVSFR